MQKYSVPTELDLPVVEVPENDLVSQEQYDEAEATAIEQYQKLAELLNAELKQFD